MKTSLKTLDDCSSREEAIAVITQALQHDPAPDPLHLSSRLTAYRSRKPCFDACAGDVAKVVLRGDSSTSKSSFLLEFSAADDALTPSSPCFVSPSESNSTCHPPPDCPRPPASGSFFASQEISWREGNEHALSRMRFEVWNTSTQQRFARSAALACLGAAAVVFIYDITRIATFLKVQQWVQELCCHFHGSTRDAESGTHRNDKTLKSDENCRNMDRKTKLVMALVGDKANLNCTSQGEEKAVDVVTARSFAERHGMIFMEMSAEARPGQIKALFIEIGIHLLKPAES